MSLRQLSALSMLACTLSIPGVTSAADLSVGGHIRMDGACSIALGNGGVVDLGTLTSTELSPPNATDYMVFKGREMSLMINCPHPTKVSVTAEDNRRGTVSDGYFDWNAFGLGNPAIGFYIIKIDKTSPKADGRDAFVIGYSPHVSAWISAGDRTSLHPGETISWGVDGTPPPPERWLEREPVAFKALTSTLVISIGLTVRKDVGVGDGMELDGSMTLELGYL